MRQIVLTPRFKRVYRQYTRRNPSLRREIDGVLAQMASDVFQPSLATHRLRGQFSGKWACSCGFDCRILFVIERGEPGDDERLVLLDMGTHDEVY